MRSRQIIGFSHTDLNINTTLCTHTDLNKTMKQVWHSMPVFISEVKKENGTKKKNEYGDICFSINHKFLRKISFKIISFFLSIVTLCDIFYSRFKRFFGLNIFLTFNFCKI